MLCCMLKKPSTRDSSQASYTLPALSSFMRFLGELLLQQHGESVWDAHLRQELVGSGLTKSIKWNPLTFVSIFSVETLSSPTPASISDLQGCWPNENDWKRWTDARNRFPRRSGSLREWTLRLRLAAILRGNSHFQVKIAPCSSRRAQQRMPGRKEPAGEPTS